MILFLSQELEEPGEDTSKYDVFMPTVVRPPKPDIVMGSETLNSEEVRPDFPPIRAENCSVHSEEKMAAVKKYQNSHMFVQNGHMIAETGHMTAQNGHMTTQNGYITIQNGLMKLPLSHVISANGFSSPITNGNVLSSACNLIGGELGHITAKVGQGFPEEVTEWLLWFDPCM